MSDTVSNTITSIFEDKNATLDSQLDSLLKLEKKIRLKEHNEQEESMQVLTAIHTLLSKDSKNNLKLVNTLENLIKKHGQFKENINKFVGLIIDGVEDLNILSKMIPILDNKIYLELNYCKLINKITESYIKKEDLQKAYDIISKLDLENVNTIDLDLKLSILLKQMKLCNSLGKYEDTIIFSKKIIPKQIFKFKELKTKFERDYYLVLIEVYNESDEYYKIGSTLKTLLSSRADKEENESFDETELIDCVNFLMLSDYDTHLNMHLLKDLQQNDKDLNKLPKLKKILDIYLSNDLITPPDLKELVVTGKYSFNNKKKETHMKHLNLKIIEHNIRCIFIYYDNIRIDRLSELLNIDSKTINLESILMDMINNGEISAKINRPLGIINFAANNNASGGDNLLEQWSDNVELLLNQLDVIDHLITKEQITYN